MTDLSHQWGADLAVGPTGDLATADGSLLGQQRVLRRLLTNPGEYIWQLDYGAGLGRFIGTPVNAGQIQAAIRSQIFKEAAVARTPEPTINVSLGPAGVVAVDIRYADATSGQTQILSFTIGG
jgi:phage baseplate assembly protein W